MSLEKHLDSETNSNSINISNIKEKIYKKSIDFLPKKMNIEETDKKECKQRTFSDDNYLLIKDFVPKLKPIGINIVPSKLRLNKKGFEDLKCNKNNKIISNKYFSSCPNTEDEEESDGNFSYKDISLFTEKDNKLKYTRKILQKGKNRNIHKVKTINNIAIKKEYEIELDNSSESDLYDIDEIKNYSIKENKDIEEQEMKNNYRDRFNSWSILEVLQKKNKFENEN